LQIEEVRNVCKLGEQANYVAIDTGSFFQPPNSKNPNTLSPCAFYNVLFGVAYKVGTRYPVFACTNAQLKLNFCKHAFCKQYFSCNMSVRQLSNKTANSKK
jgi:hypothetical protein